jgi:hypothetical protein
MNVTISILHVRKLLSSCVVTTEPFSWLFAARQLKKWYLRSRGLDCIALPVLKSDANYFPTITLDNVTAWAPAL